MAEISRKRSGELVRGVFQILRDVPEGLPSKGSSSSAGRTRATDGLESATYPKRPTVRRYEKIVRFFDHCPCEAGWLVKDKGLWSITDEGRTAFDKFKDPFQLAQESARLYRQWRAETAR